MGDGCRCGSVSRAAPACHMDLAVPASRVVCISLNPPEERDMGGKIRMGVIPALAAALLTYSAAAEYVVPSASKTITMFGKAVAVDETSLKCGVKAIKGASLLRLADCDSALEMKLPKSGISFIRFEVAPGDPQISQGWRAELRDMYVAKNGEEV